MRAFFRGRALALVVVLAACAVSLSLASTPARADGSITVTPASGSQHDTFVVAGAGFPKNTRIVEKYTSPTGEEFSFLINGEQAFIFAGEGGEFEVEIHPDVDFQGAQAGTWQVSFCLVDGSACYTGTIEISA